MCKKSVLTEHFIILVVESIRNTPDNLKLRLRDGEEIFFFIFKLDI